MFVALTFALFALAVVGLLWRATGQQRDGDEFTVRRADRDPVDQPASGAPTPVPSPVGSTPGAAEWSALLAEVDGVKFFGSHHRDLIDRVTRFLVEHPDVRRLAVRAVLDRDDEEHLHAACLLAHCCGGVPDAALAAELADLLPRLRTRLLRSVMVGALGLPRYGQDPVHPDDPIHPIVEEEVRRKLLSYATSLPPGSDFDAVLRVLTFSQDVDPSIAAFVDGMAHSEAPEVREAGVYAMSFSKRPEALAFLRDLVSSKDENGSRILGPAVKALLRTGTAEDAFAVLECSQREGLSVEAESVLLNELLQLRNNDPSVRERWRTALLRLASNRSDPFLQQRALAGVSGLVLEDDQADDAVFVLRTVAGDRDQPAASRMEALAGLDRLSSPHLRDWFWDIAAVEEENGAVRARALRCWARCATPETRDAMRRSLDGLRAMEGGTLAAEIERLRLGLRQPVHSPGRPHETEPGR